MNEIVLHVKRCDENLMTVQIASYEAIGYRMCRLYTVMKIYLDLQLFLGFLYLKSLFKNFQKQLIYD